jgi:glutathione S-transferase
LPYYAPMSDPYILHYAPDNASLIIRLALDEIGAPYKTVLVDRRIAAQKSAAYRALNPAGLIPVLETPQGPLFETGAILLWLADTHAQLAPAPDHPDRGAFLKWLFFTSNTLHADLRLTFYPALYAGPAAGAQAALRSTVQARLKTHLALLEELAATAPGWLNGGAPSVLTLYIACLMRWMALYPGGQDRGWFALSDTAHLRDMLTGLEHRPSVLLAQQAEGLGPYPFTAPVLPSPPEGSPT